MIKLNTNKGESNKDEPLILSEKRIQPPVFPVKIIRLPKVLEITSLSKGTIYNKMKIKEFPQSVSLGANSTGWIFSEVQEWLESLIAKRDSNSEAA